VSSLWRRVRPLALWALGAALLAWALARVPWPGVIAALLRLGPLEIAALLLANLLVLGLFGARWWLIARALGQRVPYLSLAAYRLAGFAVSYFTPGPQFGGEPLQAWLLNRRRAVPAGTAAASVAIDKALELLANFTFLAFGVTLSLRLRWIPQAQGAPLAALAYALLALPLGFVLAALAGARPLSALIGRVPAGWRTRAPLARLAPAVEALEGEAVRFCRERPTGLAAALGASLVSWLAVLGEFWLMLHFLGIEVSEPELVAVVTAGRLALLTPLPGGLGALEASQVLALSALGRSPAEGLSVGLVIRARDLLVGLAGLALAATLARQPSAKPGLSAGRDSL
jgi:glycosyltransferase 2 family protein